jgi:guanylate kinase
MEMERAREFDRRVTNDVLERAAHEVHQTVLHYLSQST